MYVLVPITWPMADPRGSANGSNLQFFRLKVKGSHGMIHHQEQGWVSGHYREKESRPHLIWEVDKTSSAPVVFTTVIRL